MPFASPSNATASAQEPLQISAFGPSGLGASERFYPQTDGEVAMWVALNRPLGHANAVIWLEGRPLQETKVDGKVITGALPASLRLQAGLYHLQVRWGEGNDQGETPEVDFVVEPGHDWNRAQ
ncbi:hypothetical protein [uncultured Xanthomonas sp.]|nr:hypothetical protein [uncultured Xanthomonas sp.]